MGVEGDFSVSVVWWSGKRAFWASSIIIRPDTCIFEGAGYQLHFEELCTVENERQDTIELYYYYSIDGTDRHSREPYLGMLFRKDDKYYLRSLILGDEAVYDKDVEVERRE